MIALQGARAEVRLQRARRAVNAAAARLRVAVYMLQDFSWPKESVRSAMRDAAEAQQTVRRLRTEMLVIPAPPEGWKISL